MGKATFLKGLLSETVPDTDLLFAESGIESARQAVEFCKTQPLVGSDRYVLVDEAHLLTEAAQDAYLKLLEEPGGHSFVIFITPDDGLLQPAIKSRFRYTNYWSLLTPEEMKSFAIAFGSGEDSKILALCDGRPGLFTTMFEDEGGTKHVELYDYLFQVLEGKKNPLIDPTPDIIKEAKERIQRECVAHICIEAAQNLLKSGIVPVHKIAYLLRYGSLLISVPSANAELHWLNTAVHVTL